MNKTLVLIPSYNDSPDLIRSIKSVDAEEAVDILVVDDGSEIKPEIDVLMTSYRGKGNVRLLCLQENGGITKALNAGLRWADDKGYKFIARLDAGDIVVGRRFFVQQKYMEENVGVGVVGSWVDFVTIEGRFLFTLKHPVDNDSIMHCIYRYNPFVHPATMIRLDCAMKVGGYPHSYPALEDWGLFIAMSRVCDFHNLPEVYLKYVVSDQSISSKKRFIQSKSKVCLLLDNYKFNFNQTVGLIKNIFIMFFPRSYLTFVKRLIWRGGHESS